MSFAVRTPARDVVTGGVRAAIMELDPNLPVAELSTLRDAVNRSKQLRAFTLYLLLVAAGVALLLGAVGLYGVVSYLVSRRGREIAIRMAVGARHRDIRRLVLREALMLGVAGIALGLIGAGVLTRSMGALLHEVSPLDPLTYITVPLVLLAVSLGASYLPRAAPPRWIRPRSCTATDRRRRVIE